MATASIVTIGNELVSGDIVNTNGSWLAARLEALGVDVVLIASLPDEEERIAALVGAQAAEADVVLVTGGLGGTPDDITREALAAAFGVDQQELPELAADLRSRFPRDVVGRPAEAAGHEQAVDAGTLPPDEVRDRLDLVGDGGGEDDPDAERLEALREPGRVRVRHVAGDNLVPDREDRAEH
jgi:molybdenum cofactor synthesis domain-containing protein